MTVFPQEKIYLHPDKPFYITGEKIWFRAYLVNAASYVPFPLSRYIYVELFNPLDSLLTRVKIRNNNDAYHGYIDIPADIPDGDYILRAYTNFMLSLGTITISAPTASASAIPIIEQCAWMSNSLSTKTERPTLISTSSVLRMTNRLFPRMYA